MLIAWRRRVLRIDRRDLPALFGCAILGVAANQELFVQGLARSTATNATVLGSTIPVFTALVAIALGREPVHPRRLLGIAVAFTGVAVLVGADNMSLSSGHVIGSAMILLNSLCYGTYLVVVRPLAEKYDPLGLIAWLFMLGVPMVLPLGLVEFARTPAFHAGDIGYFAFLIAVPTVCAYGLVQVALRRTESSLVAVAGRRVHLLAAGDGNGRRDVPARRAADATHRGVRRYRALRRLVSSAASQIAPTPSQPLPLLERQPQPPSAATPCTQMWLVTTMRWLRSLISSTR
jgi:drug/metabolite transporter (DMT)-like permease